VVSAEGAKIFPECEIFLLKLAFFTIFSQKCQKNAKFENNAKHKFPMPTGFQKCQIREIWH
jgi:hypothetical protein